MTHERDKPGWGSSNTYISLAYLSSQQASEELNSFIMTSYISSFHSFARKKKVPSVPEKIKSIWSFLRTIGTLWTRPRRSRSSRSACRVCRLCTHYRSPLELLELLELLGRFLIRLYVLGRQWVPAFSGGSFSNLAIFHAIFLYLIGPYMVSPKFYNASNPKSVNNGTETLRNLGPKIWKLIPDELKNITSLPLLFKQKIKSWIPLIKVICSPTGLIRLILFQLRYWFLLLCHCIS